MAVKLTSTANAVMNGVKCLVYGPAGAGKTVLCSTAPNPVIFSAESGLLSLADHNIPVVEIGNINDLKEAYVWALNSAEAKKFDTICLDSLSEIGENILSDLKKTHKDPRKAYGEVQEEVLNMIKGFRDMPEKFVYFAAKQETSKDTSTGMMYTKPMMPGTKLPEAIPYLFDEVFQLYVHTDMQTKQQTRHLRTAGDMQTDAKDRSGRLDQWEEPNLTAIFQKIMNKTNT